METLAPLALAAILGGGAETSVQLIIELPGNVAIVGVLKVALPTEDAALIKLQANFVGAIEFDAKRLWFFAALFDSRLLFLSLEGEMGVLVSWGAQPVFLVSVGGFHPRFVAPALPFPSPRRLAVSVLDTDAARITVSGYLAVTSNSVQFGATAELFFGYSDFRIEGHIAFDALVDFPPIHFVVEVTARVSLKVFGLGLFSIKLEFTLEGTSPWRAKGRGTLSLLFFDVSADFDETWGEPDATALDPVSVLDLVVAELAKVSSWTAVLPAGGSTARGVGVTLRAPTADEADEVVLHPVGSLRVSQRAVPLDLQIARVGARRAADVAQVGLAVTGATFAKRADVDEQFAVAQYVDMDDAAKVSRPSFEPNHGGVEIAGAAPAAATARATRRNVRYEEVVIDEKFRRRRRRFVGFESSLFDHFVAGAAVARSPLSQANQARLDPFADAIATGDRSYVVASTVDNSVHPGTALFTSEVAATQFLAQLVAEDPTLADQAQVLPAYDAVGVRS